MSQLTEQPENPSEPEMSVWGVLVERSLRLGDPATYEYMKQQGTLAAHIQWRESEMAAMYEARIKEGLDEATAVNSTIRDYAAKMANEEMTESDAEMIVTQWLASRSDGEPSNDSPKAGAYPKHENCRIVNGEEARRLGLPIVDEHNDPFDSKGMAAMAADAMQYVFGQQPREARFAVLELIIVALADNGPLEASNREMDNFEALAGDDPESLLAAVNKTIKWESCHLPGKPSPENLREWADQLVSLTISSYPSDELPGPL